MTATRPPPPLIRIFVDDRRLAQCERFYREVLDCKVIAEADHAPVDPQDAASRLAPVICLVPTRTGVALRETGLSFPVSDLAAAQHHMTALGLVLPGTHDADRCRFQIVDPSGNLLTIVEQAI